MYDKNFHIHNHYTHFKIEELNCTSFTVKGLTFS